MLRGLMALAVAVYHLGIWNAMTQIGSRTNTVLAILGNYGVQGFFVVSGFCFFFLYRDTRWNGKALAGFHIKRFFRIAPLYYLAVIANIVLKQPVVFSTNARMLSENATLTFGLFHPNHALVLGGWSIGIEYVFYLALPLLLILTRRTWAMALLAIALVAVAWPWTFHWIPAASHAHDMKFHTYVLVRNHAFLFLMGGLLARLWMATPRRLSPWVGAGLLLLVAILVWPRGPVSYDHFEMLVGWARVRYVAAFVAAVGIFSFTELPQTHWRRALVILGDLSYSVYLLHPFAQLASVHLIGTAHPTANFLLGLGLTLALAWVVYQYLERPAMALGRRLAGKLA